MTLNHYVRLIAFKAWADLRAERERTYLGLLWWVIEPALFMLVFYLIFGVLRGNRGAEFVAFLLVGVVSWQWFRASVSHCGNSVLQNLALMSQVRLPPLIFPLIVVVTDTFKFAIVLILLLTVLSLMGHVPGAWFLALPLVLLTVLLLATGCGLIYAALVPFLPDLRHVMDTLLMAAMFVSGIFYSIGDLQPPYNELLYFNPMAGLIEDSRSILLHNAPPAWGRLALSALVGAVLTAVGAFMFLSLGRRYTKLPC